MRSLLPFFLLLPLAAQQPQPVQPQPGQAGQKGGGRAMPAPKNLKVLKLQQPNELLPVMMAYRNALGAQNCDYCHIRGDFASDENPKKEIARKMIGMVQEINEKLESLGIQHTAAAPAAAAPAPAGPGGGPGGAPVVTANIGARAADFVTCYTCHRGQAQPQTVGPPPAPPAGR